MSTSAWNARNGNIHGMVIDQALVPNSTISQRQPCIPVSNLASARERSGNSCIFARVRSRINLAEDELRRNGCRTLLQVGQ